jgi:ATPase family AAA domain-containing protein 3A/B
MDYAIMSGGDVGPLGEDAVSQLNSLFRWASRSSTGLLLFIDEAEAFLSARGKVGLVGVDDSHVRHALNALLYRTSSGSCNFMLVLATNRPEDLDSAVLDRIDVSLYIGLPTQQQREKLVRLYMDVNLKSVALRLRRSWWPFSKKYSVDENCSSDDVIADIAEQCDGFSGREISKLFIACQYSLMTERRSFTVEHLKQTVIAKMKEHEQKAGFTRSSNNNSPSNNNLKSKASARTVMSGQ